MPAESPDPPDTPRLSPLPEAEWDDVLKVIAATTGPLNIFTTLGRHPDLLHAWIGLGSMLLSKGTLDARTRELLILRVAHHRSSEYEWHHHRRLGLEAGLSEVEIAALRLPTGDHPWTDDDRAVLTAADELHDTGTLGDATWDVLSRRFGERELIELIFVVGHYHMVAFALNALRVQPEKDA
ncbi:carboxymuconolactone decarboxylase family protein [Spirillospora sp. CA-294931]|uniref:carboxymuconolactone decarboxylase family protein n=1 Tax=Spirillospora sp. CA-294931 TaxID=3240042 RepID=UPI003D8A4D92